MNSRKKIIESDGIPLYSERHTYQGRYQILHKLIEWTWPISKVLYWFWRPKLSEGNLEKITINKDDKSQGDNRIRF